MYCPSLRPTAACAQLGKPGGAARPPSRLSRCVFALLTLALLALGRPSVHAAPKCPNLAILLDQSHSMAENPQGQTESDRTKTKWGIATTALTSINNRFNGRLPIAYTNFPRYDGSCVVYDTFRIPVSYSNLQAINNALIDNPFAGGTTPMCTAISKLADEMAFTDPQRPNYILLVTDGIPESACCGVDPVQNTVDAITAAASQSPAVKTIVVGFGNLPQSDRDALNRMAVAGKLPNKGTTQFYEATDSTTLNTVLDGILRTLVTGDAGDPLLCEDGCYGSGCPTGQVCLKNACTANPCASSNPACPDGQSCLFDGTAASCVAACKDPCPRDTRCSNGKCIPDPCGGPCPSGQRCVGGACENDPSCSNVICHASQGCFAGKCIDNPCTYTTCPDGTGCVDFTGMCMAPRPDTGSGTVGCACQLGSHTSANWMGPLSACLLVALLLRRRARSVRASQSRPLN